MPNTDISQDLSLVSLFGSNITLNSAGLLTTAIFYGVYVVLFCCTIPILCNKEGNTRAKLVLLAAVITMFAIATFFIASYMQRKCQGIRKSGRSAILFRGHYRGLCRCLESMGAMVGQPEDSDRALSATSRVSSTLAFLGCFIEDDWPITLPPTCSSLNIATYVLSMATNITATCAIGYKVWLHWRVVKKYLGTFHARGGIEKVLVLLLESGVAYSMLWFLQVITLIPSVGASPVGAYVQQVLYAASVQLVGIYPTLVIVLVYLQRSLWDSSGSSTYVQAVVSEHSRNHRPIERGEDAELDILKPTRLVLEDGESHRSSTLTQV
uniref:Uncharacterized protein n=1 Tax=Moniliophthora roreri TaxID=221103 RepID=A0A0W0FDP8_MONRR